MNPSSSFFSSLSGLLHPLMVGGLLLTTLAARGESTDPAVDDFSVAEIQPSGVPRMLINDKDAGGTSQAKQSIENGMLHVTGSIKPGRGSPGFVSLPLILTADGSPRDLSSYEGIRLMVKVETGSLSVQISSTEITNFDYHTSAPLARATGGLKEVRIPFSALKRVWSEQTELNLKTVTSINLVSAGMMPAEFAYAIDEIGFY